MMAKYPPGAYRPLPRRGAEEYTHEDSQKNDATPVAIAVEARRSLSWVMATNNAMMMVVLILKRGSRDPPKVPNFYL